MLVQVIDWKTVFQNDLLDITFVEWDVKPTCLPYFNVATSVSMNGDCMTSKIVIFLQKRSKVH